jgi:hypothetical protein
MTEYIWWRNVPVAPAVVIHSVKGCSRARVPVVRAVYSPVAVGVELVDDVRRRVEPVLQRGIRGQCAHETAVARTLDEMRLDAQMPAQQRALETDAPGLPEHDAGLAPCRRGDVDLGLGLAVGDEEVVAEGRGEERLPVLPRQPEADFLVHAQARGRVDLEGLPGELALPGLEDERLAGPAALRVAHVPLAEGREAGTAGEVIGDHISANPRPPMTDGPSDPPARGAG